MAYSKCIQRRIKPLKFDIPGIPAWYGSELNATWLRDLVRNGLEGKKLTIFAHKMLSEFAIIF